MTQKEALRILKAGHNVFLTGSAGSGKTYLINQFINYLKDEGIGVGVTASTGIAATHLGGMTIHSWAGIGINSEFSGEDIKVIATDPRMIRRLERTRVLIIDEISMLDAKRLDAVDRVLRFARYNQDPFGGLQVVFCGDFFQLPPVSRENDFSSKFAYEANAWREMDLKICYLHEQHRQGDDKLTDVLNAIRAAEVDAPIVETLRSRQNAVFDKDMRISKLYTHNADVDAENERELMKLEGKERVFEMRTSGATGLIKALRKGCLAPDELRLKVGAVVMFVKNNFDEGYVNGTVGEVIKFDNHGFPVVKTKNGKIFTAQLTSWGIEENGKTLAEIAQLPLRLAWAITVHKSQGMTLDAVQVDLRGAFENGMGYVALSRVRSLEGLKLLGFNQIALEVDENVLAKDREFKKLSNEACAELEEGNIEEKIIEPVKNDKTYSVEELRKTHPAAYQKWSSEEDARLIEEFESGMKIKELAEIHGRKRGGISSRLKKLGLLDNK